jgi:hypothetical protein
VSPQSIDALFSRAMGQVLETSQALFGEHEKWPFLRKVILKRLNELKDEVKKDLKERNGYGRDDEHQPSKH